MPTEADLGEFEDWPVTAVKAIMKKLGDGLSKAVETSPVKLHSGDTAYALVEVKVGNILMAADLDKKEYARVQNLIGQTVTFVDADFAVDHISAQRRKNDAMEASKKGTGRLNLNGELEAEHRDGSHEKGLVPGCPLCEELAAGNGPEAPTPLAGRARRRRAAEEASGGDGGDTVDS